MNSCSFTFGITSIANGIASNLSDEELGIVAAAFTQLGDTLATIAVQRAICNKVKE